MVNYAGFFTSTTMGLPRNFNYDPRVKQILFKNGLRAVTPLDTARRLILDGFVIETNFAKAATVRGHTTLGVSLQWKVTRKNHITFGANYDFGKDHTSWSLGLSSVWRF
jgi:hypothetical protein